MRVLGVPAVGWLFGLVAAPRRGSAAFLRGDGDGTFSGYATSAVGTSPRGMTVADFDRDGRTDVLQLFAQGVEPVGSTPQEFASFLQNETTVWAKVIKSSGLKPE